MENCGDDAPGSAATRSVYGPIAFTKAVISLKYDAKCTFNFKDGLVI